MNAISEPPAQRRLGVDAGHHHYKWWALSCTSLGMLLATINSGTLIIALPDLGKALHTSILSLVWVILAYMIASTVLVLTAGRLSDLFGRKRAYVGGFVVFSLASLGVAMGTNTMVAAVGLVLGPVLGGALVAIDWPWVFWFNVPFGLAGALWGGYVLHE